MWIMLNDSFFSAVHKDCAKDEILVRARIKGDIEKVFNDETLLKANPTLKPVVVTRYTKSDYLYRAVVKRDHYKAVMCAETDRVVYSNFKASTRDAKLHGAYNQVWHVMSKLQELPPYSNGRQWDIPNSAVKTHAIKKASGDMFSSMFDDYGDDDDVFSANPKLAAMAVDKKAKKAKKK